MRPESIRRFDMFYLGSIALSVVGYLVSYNAMVSQMEARTAAAGMQLGSGVVIGTIVLSTAISLLLWYLASRKGIDIAKWIIVLFFVLGLLSSLGIAGSPGLLSGNWTLLRTLSALVLLLEAAAVYYLFQPDAKAWFAGTKGDVSDPSQDR
jgi:hypothetical protein